MALREGGLCEGRSAGVAGDRGTEDWGTEDWAGVALLDWSGLWDGGWAGNWSGVWAGAI